MEARIDEGERQMMLLALAKLSLEHPGWDDALNRLACKHDNVNDGRAVMYDDFRQIHEADERLDEDELTRRRNEAVFLLGILAGACGYLRNENADVTRALVAIDDWHARGRIRTPTDGGDS